MKEVRPLLPLYLARILTHARQVEWLEGGRPAEQAYLNGLEGLTLVQGTRQMSSLSTISASWIICDSWAGVAATVALAIVQGGPVTMIYGLILMFLLGGACVLSLAELASVYPTAGGQYHWTSILAPKYGSRALVCQPSTCWAIDL